MTDTEPQRCAHVITGPKVGRNVVAWRRRCLRVVKVGERYCWQHRGEHPSEPRWVADRRGRR